MPRANLLSLFNTFPRLGDKVAVIETLGYRQQKTTYASLHATAVAWSNTLEDKGIRPGDRVLLWGANSSFWVACFWAVLLRGAVAVPMDAAANVAFVERTVRDAAVKLILSDRQQPPLSAGVPRLDWNSNPSPIRRVAQSSGDAIRGIPADSPAEILFTSGTTSEPRGVVLTHANFLANLEPLERGIEEYRKYLRWWGALRFVSLVPLSHVFGQFMALFVPPLIGAAIVFENSPHPADVFRAIREHRATALICVPRMLDSLRDAMEREIDRRGLRFWFNALYAASAASPFLHRAMHFSRIHRWLGWKFWAFICGGAALSPETEQFFRRIAYGVVQGYGMTETASLISVNHPFRSTQGSVGKILPGREFRLAEDGEILVRGRNVASAYWQSGKLQQAAGAGDGWLPTGDLGEFDAQGNLRFRGRKKNVIVTPAGLNIYPEDLEAALKKQAPVRDAVVVPVSVGGNAEAAAMLLPASGDVGAPAVLQSAVDAANASLAEYQRIRRWTRWPDPDFPRTSTGKPRLAEIAERAPELLAAGNMGPARQGSATSEADPLLGGIDLASLSSLDRVELLARLENRYNVELNETQFAAAKSAQDIRRLLAEPSARRTDYAYPRWTQFAAVRWLRLFVYYALTWPATLILGHPRVVGRKNLEAARGPLLFVANHTTRRADMGLVLFALPARYRHRLAAAMGGETLQTMRHPPKEWFFLKRWLWRMNYFLVVALFSVFPLPQLSGFRESFRFAGETVDRGYSILVFPEGRVNDRDSPEMVAFQSGIGLLTQNLGIQVVPMRLDGVWQMKQEKRRLARPGELTVHIGPPVNFPASASAAEIAEQLQNLVRSL